MKTPQLTESEIACGVTPEAVIEQSSRALVIDGGEAAVLGKNLAPALAGAAARHRLGGAVSFAGFKGLGLPVYRKEAAA